METPTACRVIRVNSKYRLPGGTSSNFVYSIGDTRIANRVMDLTLVSARIPRMFTNIYYPINQLNMIKEDIEMQSFVPPGQYTATELATQMSSVMLDSGMDVSYDVNSHRFIFHARQGDVLLLVNSPLASYIGLHEDTLCKSGIPKTLLYQPTLDGPSCVYIQSQALSLNIHCVDTLQVGTYIPLVAVVDCTTPYGFTISYECKDVLSQRIDYRSSQNYPNLSYFDIQLCDQYGNLLDMPPNSYCDLVFKITVDTS